MKYGVNLMLFGDTVDGDVLDEFERIREIGFDGVEVPVFEPESVDVGAIRERAEEIGLSITCSGALPAGASFCGDDEARQTAETFVRGAVGVAAELGSPVVAGPLYKAVGETGGASLDEQRAMIPEALRPLCDEAAEAGVRLAFEPLNRFETDLLNTAAQGVEFVEAIGSDGAGLLLDTFHMHIEEKDTSEALRDAAAAGALAHVHSSENDRGIPGTGQVDWEGAAGALWVSDYDGWVVMETFGQGQKAIRRASSLWRPLYPSAEEFMREGLEFVRATFG